MAATSYGGGNDIWTSSDSGATWTNETAGTAAANQVWVGVASGGAGAHLIAVSSNPGGLDPLVGGDIWTN